MPQDIEDAQLTSLAKQEDLAAAMQELLLPSEGLKKRRIKLVKKRSTKSVKPAKKVKSLSLSAKKAKGVKGGSFQWGVGRGIDQVASGHEKWIE
ncbi:MAG TPA: hypothetical protein VEG84_04545 [Thermoanaerobaculia bacterium]|nr:hypothetical protein [Thermoanaerobaculia bacterium]